MHGMFTSYLEIGLEVQVNYMFVCNNNYAILRLGFRTMCFYHFEATIHGVKRWVNGVIQ